MNETVEQAGEGEQVGMEDVAQVQFEAEARKDGWDPDRYAKDDPAWVDAKTFVERGKEIKPFLTKQNDRLRAELASQKQELESLSLTLKEFGKMYKQVQENAYARAIEEAKKEKREASKEGNEDLADQLADHIEALKEKSKNIEVPTEKLSQTPIGPNPVLEMWKEKNEWFGKDRTLTRLANAIADEFSHSHKHLQGKKEFLDLVDEELRTAMPEKFQNSQRAVGSPVSSGTTSRATASKGAKGFSDLPSEAKGTCDKIFSYSGLASADKEKFRTDYAKAFFKTP